MDLDICPPPALRSPLLTRYGQAISKSVGLQGPTAGSPGDYCSSNGRHPCAPSGWQPQMAGAPQRTWLRCESSQRAIQPSRARPNTPDGSSAMRREAKLSSRLDAKHHTCVRVRDPENAQGTRIAAHRGLRSPALTRSQTPEVGPGREKGWSAQGSQGSHLEGQLPKASR